jgi:hypothetical protein
MTKGGFSKLKDEGDDERMPRPSNIDDDTKAFLESGALESPFDSSGWFIRLGAFYFDGILDTFDRYKVT